MRGLRDNLRKSWIIPTAAYYWNVILMGRPSTDDVLSRVDELVDLFHVDYGGLPRAVEVDEILREIWIEDTYHSSALEGNQLSKRQVAALLETDQAHGSLSDSLEVKGYGTAARWVYEHAPDHPWDRGVPLSVIRTVHTLLVAPAWALNPPEDHSAPGDYRRQAVRIANRQVTTCPPVAIEGKVADWVDATRHDPPAHFMVHLADLHAWFERIHPFADGNGRAGRLLLNFMLLQRGYPPAVLNETSRELYLRGLARADQGHPTMLAELISRAAETSLNKFLIPKLAGTVRLIPLGALASETDYSPGYLRLLAASGRLRAVREGRIWLSSRKWLEEYRTGRKKQRRTAKEMVRAST